MLASAWRHIRRRRRNLRRTRDELLAINLRRFREFARFAAKRSPYYRDIVREHGIDLARATPSDFPELTKTDLIEHFDRIVTRKGLSRARIEEFLSASREPTDLMDGRYHIVHTSGTSGQVCYVAYTPSEWMTSVSQFERLVRIGWRRRVAFVGAIGGHFAGVSLATASSTMLSKLAYVTKAFDLNMPTEDLRAALVAFQPRAIIGYAKALVRLGEEKAAGRLDIAPRAIICGGESVSVQEMQRMQDVFGCRVRNAYATSEHLFMGFNQADHPGMFLLEDDLIFDLKEDHIHVTNLFNRTVPLIRHRMNDSLLEAGPDVPPNGPYKMVQTVLGRQEESPVFTNESGAEDYIHPIVIAEFFVKNLQSFQMHCLGPTEFRFDVIVAPGLTDDETATFERECAKQLNLILTQKRMRNVTYQVRHVDSLQRDTKSHKFKLILR